MKMENRVALVTGGCGGVGIEVSKLLAKEGASVVITDLNETVGLSLVQEITEQGGKALFFKADVTKEAEVKSCVTACIDHFGKLDTLINIACIMTVETGYIHEVTSEMFDKDIDINLKGTFLFTKYAIPELIKCEDSSIVNFSTVAAIRGMVGHSIYAAAKQGVEAFTRMVATQYGQLGLRANCIRPGVMVNPTWENTDFGKEYSEYMLTHMPAKRIGKSADAASVVLFFASNDSAYVNGQVLTMDGGLTCHEPQWKEDLAQFEKGLR